MRGGEEARLGEERKRRKNETRRNGARERWWWWWFDCNKGDQFSPHPLCIPLFDCLNKAHN